MHKITAAFVTLFLLFVLPNLLPQLALQQEDFFEGMSIPVPKKGFLDSASKQVFNSKNGGLSGVLVKEGLSVRPICVCFGECKFFEPIQSTVGLLGIVEIVEK